MTTIYIVALVVGFLVGAAKMLYGGWLPYIVMDSLIAGLGIPALISVVRDPDRRARLSITQPFLILGAYAIVGVLNPGVRLPLGLMGFRGLLLYSTLFFAGYEALQHVRQVRRIYVALMVLGTAAAVFGLWQWKVGPSVVATWGGWYQDFSRRMIWTRVSGNEFVFRAFSTFVQPGVFGATMAFVMLLTLGSFLEKRAGIVKRIALIAAFTVMGAGMIVSASRLSLVIVLTGAAVILWLRGADGRRWTLLVQTAAIIVVGLWIATTYAGPVFMERFSTIGSSESFFARWFNPLAEGLRLGIVHPLGFGLGYTSGLPFFVADGWVQDLASGTRNIDSGIGAVAAELGIVGAMLYLFFVFRVAVESVRAWKALPPSQLKDLLVAPAAMGCLGLLLSPIANFMQPSVPPAIIYWFSIGMLMKAPDLARQAALERRRMEVRQGLSMSGSAPGIQPRARPRIVRLPGPMAPPPVEPAAGEQPGQ